MHLFRLVQFDAMPEVERSHELLKRGLFRANPGRPLTGQDVFVVMCIA